MASDSLLLRKVAPLKRNIAPSGVTFQGCGRRRSRVAAKTYTYGMEALSSEEHSTRKNIYLVLESARRLHLLARCAEICGFDPLERPLQVLVIRACPGGSRSSFLAHA